MEAALLTLLHPDIIDLLRSSLDPHNAKPSFTTFSMPDPAAVRRIDAAVT